MSLIRLAAVAIREHARLSRGLTAAWLVTLGGSMALPVASAALVGGVVGAVPHGVSAIVPPLIALTAVELASNPCQAYGWVICWALGRHYRLVHRERIMRALLDPPGVAHLSPQTLDAARNADNPWVVNMLEGVNNLIVARVTGAGGLLIVGFYPPLAAAILAAAWIYMGAWRWRRTTVTWRVVAGQTQTMRRAQAMSDMALTPAAAKEVRLFGLRSWIGARYASFLIDTVPWRQRLDLRIFKELRPLLVADLDQGFFSPRFHKLPHTERELLTAIARVGESARYEDLQWPGKRDLLRATVARLVERGHLYRRSAKGEVAFTLPLYREFLLRTVGEA